MNAIVSASSFHPVRRTQRGAVLLLTLIILVVLLVGSVALVRSFDTSLLVAGNLAFKRDLVNQGELALPRILTAFNTIGAALDTPDKRANNVTAENYSAVLLPSNAQGIPLALVNGTGFGTITLAGTQGVQIKYVVDRMCNAAGLDVALGPAACVLADNGVPPGGSSPNLNRAEIAGPNGEQGAVPQQVIYRVSVRVDGPRNTQAFLQTTFAL